MYIKIPYLRQHHAMHSYLILKLADAIYSSMISMMWLMFMPFISLYIKDQIHLKMQETTSKTSF